MREKKWKIKSSKVNREQKDWLVKTLAVNRGLDSEKKLADFLNPTIDQIKEIKLTDLEKGIERVKSAIKSKEKVIIYSDYDADGINATAIIWETLYDIGANVMPYVPHRITEGYGLNVKTIEELAKGGVKLIITVDNGVTAVKQVEAARELGVDIIVTDHHVMPEIRPEPYAMVHTTELCGAGVSWLFCYHIIKKLKPDYESKLLKKLELAAIATIADLVPLNAACRAIVKFGLVQLNNTRRPGLRALLSQAKIFGQIGTYEIGHIIAPRINAMGRIEHGMDSLRLICAKNDAQATTLASLLARTNTKRKDLTIGAVDTAFDMVNREHLVGVIANKDWHEGVIGLVASRLVETHYRPMIVISEGVTRSKGSARSIPGFNIVEAIRASSQFLVDAGGHPMAAGFTIETKHIEAFTKSINVYAQTAITEDLLTPSMEIECELKPEDITFENYQKICEFEPFGVANPEPVFISKKLQIEDIRKVGKDSRHLKIDFAHIGAIGFGMGQTAQNLRPGDLVDVAFTIAPDNYNNKKSLQLKIKDLKKVIN